MNIQDLSHQTMNFGLVLAVTPVAVTTVISLSKMILIDALLYFLSGGRLYMRGISLVKVPFLWKVSKFSAIAGISIAALSVIVSKVDEAYKKKYV